MEARTQSNQNPPIIIVIWPDQLHKLPTFTVVLVSVRQYWLHVNWIFP